MPTDPAKDRLVVLVSSGDPTSKYVRRAGRLARDLKSSGQFADVFFSGWLKRGEFDRNLELLNDAIGGGTRFILYLSPFGRSSYEEFVARGRNAAWKDEFVVGARSLLGRKAKGVYVVFHSEMAGRNEVLCGDFKKSSGCYDLSKEFDRKVFFTKLIGFRYSRKNNRESSECGETDNFL